MTTPFELSSRLIDDLAKADPLLATFLGVPGFDHLWPDLSPEGWDSRAEMLRTYRRGLAPHLDHDEPRQRLASEVLIEWIDITLASHEAGDHLRAIGHMNSPLQGIRGVFDVMDKASSDSWKAVCERLSTVDQAWSGYLESLLAGLGRGLAGSRRQVESAISQARELVGEGSAWTLLVHQATTSLIDPAVVEEAVAMARRHTQRFIDEIEARYLPFAEPDDGVGRERYLRAAYESLGMQIIPEEIYQWGWSEIGRLRDQMAQVGSEIAPGAGSVAEVARILEEDPARSAHSNQEFLAFIEERLLTALSELDGVHFEVAPEIRELTVNIAPPGGALGAYYLAPTEDFTRPGGVWYSVGERTVHPLYQEVSTAYHEGFPGHHLQIGTSMAAGDRLSRAHRALVWYSGYGEGWALYTERLMEELGYFEKPDYTFGMLASHIFRAARVVVDIGLHLGLTIPHSAPAFPGERWTFERGVDFMQTVGMQPRDYAVSEVIRYLGWPGQAISYKVGEREILSLRDELRKRDGFDPKEFHRKVLGDGAMGLSRLRRRVIQS